VLGVLLFCTMITTLSGYEHGQRAWAASSSIAEKPICQGNSSFNSLLSSMVTDPDGAGSRRSLLHYEATLGNYWRTVTNSLPSDLQADAAKMLAFYHQEFNAWLAEGGKPHWLQGKLDSTSRNARVLGFFEPVANYLRSVCLE
jgi:hypothetical protein